MESGRKFVNAAAIITIVYGLFFMFASAIFGAIILAIGIAMLVFSSQIDEENYKKYKVLFLIGAIVFLLFSPIASILLFVAIDRFNTGLANAPPGEKKDISKKEKVSKEVRRIDLLLKLGVLMVSISGILFATTKWDIITGIMKCIVLFVIASVFLFLYKYTKEKLKLVKSSNSYFILSMMFFILTFVAMAYFEVISTWFTYVGEGKYLVYSLTFGIIGCLTYLTVDKLKLNKTIYLAYISLYLALYFILKFCFIDGAIICLILELISFSILIILKDETKHPLYKLNKLLSYSYFILIIATENGNISLPCEIIGIGLLIYLLSNNKDKVSSILIPLFANVIVMTITNAAATESIKEYVYLILSNVIYWIILSIKNKSKYISITNDLIYSISMCFFMLWLSSYETNFTVFITSIVYLLTIMAISCRVFKIESSSVPKYASLAAIPAFVLSSIDMLKLSTPIEPGIRITFVILAYAIVHNIISNKALRTTYLVAISILTYICLLESIEGTIDAAIAAIIGLGYLVKYCSKSTNTYVKNGFTTFNFIFLLVAIYNLFITGEFLSMTGYFESLLVIWIYLVILYFLKDETKKKVVLVALCLPLFTFVDSLSGIINYNLIMILNNLVFFYLIIIIAKCFIKNKNKLNFWVSLGVIISLLSIMFNRDLVVALYVGIISLIVMFLGYYKEEVRSLFKVGLVAIVFNIFYQLYDVLKMIPFWIYLLVVGLGLIAFVTIKETKKLPTENEEKK